MEFNFLSTVRYKSDEPYILKKVLTTLLILAIFVWFCVDIGVWFVAIEIFWFYFFLIKPMNTEKASFFKTIKKIYKNMYKRECIDKLNTKIIVKNEKLEIAIKNAEYFKKRVYSKTYDIDRDKVKSIYYFKGDGCFEICYSDIIIKMVSGEFTRNVKLLNEQAILLYLDNDDANSLYDGLIQNGYDVLDGDNEINKEKEAFKASQLKKEEKQQQQFAKKYHKLIGKKDV